MISRLSELEQYLQGKQKSRIAVAGAHDEHVLESINMVYEKGFAVPILVGDKAKIEKIAAEINMDISSVEIIDESDNIECVRKAMMLIHENEADVVMKGKVMTAEIMKGAMNKEYGIRTGKLISHIGVYETEKYHKLLFVSDPAINIAPDLNAKVQIIQNAVGVAKKFGIDTPKVAVLSAVEKITESMPSTVDAAILSKMAQRGQIADCMVDGPLAMDNAISLELAKHKGIDSQVSGDVDIMIAPNIEAANIMIKTMVFLFGAKACNIVAGTKAPIVVTSRSDDSQTKYYSILAAIIVGMG